MQTPCVSVCIMNPVTGMCEGCRRTIDEIVAWARMTDGERRRIMSELPGRPMGVPCGGR